MEPADIDELPPPYTPLPEGGVPMINCKVCQALINLQGKEHLHVVKCGVCGEATVSHSVMSFISILITCSCRLSELTAIFFLIKS